MSHLEQESSCNIITSLTPEDQEKMDSHVFTKHLVNPEEGTEDTEAIKKKGDADKALEEEIKKEKDKDTTIHRQRK